MNLCNVAIATVCPAIQAYAKIISISAMLNHIPFHLEGHFSIFCEMEEILYLIVPSLKQSKEIVLPSLLSVWINDRSSLQPWMLSSPSAVRIEEHPKSTAIPLNT